MKRVEVRVIKQRTGQVRRSICRREWAALIAATATVIFVPVIAAVPAAGIPALRVEQLQGQVQLQRQGQKITLHAGDAVQTRDIVTLGKDARVSLSLTGRGTLQLAGASQFSVEQLLTLKPAGSTRRNARPAPDIFSLEHGDLHLQWGTTPSADQSTEQATPQAASAARAPVQPLYIYFAQRRIELQPGEYFLRQQGNDAQVCVAEGQAATMAITDGAHRVIGAAQCEQQHRGPGGGATEIVAHNAASWSQLRQQFAIAAAASTGHQVASLRMDSAISRPSKVSAPAAAPALAAPKAVVTSPQVTGSAPSTDGNDGAAWAINVASYADADSAHQQQQDLQSSGYTAVVVPAQVNDHTWYRVQVSGFATPAAAHAQAVALQSDLGFRQLWVTRQP